MDYNNVAFTDNGLSIDEMFDQLDEEIKNDLKDIFDTFNIKCNEQFKTMVAINTFATDRQDLEDMKLLGSIKDYNTKVASLKSKMLTYSPLLLQPIVMMFPMPEPLLKDHLHRLLKVFISDKDAIEFIYTTVVEESPRRDSKLIKEFDAEPEYFTTLSALNYKYIIIPMNATEVIETTDIAIVEQYKN